jgi:uroporphyrinogen III methyltransferase/synthase
MSDPKSKPGPMAVASSGRPLAGKRIVITRAREQAENLARSIEELGGEIVEFPTIEICPPQDFVEFDAAIERIDSYDWIIFTSVNSVEPFLQRLHSQRKTSEELRGRQIAAIGAETAKHLAAEGIRASLVPERYQAEGFLDAISPDEIRDKRVLIPRAAEAREVLPATLRKWGARVDVIVAYRTGLPTLDIRPLDRLLADGKIDVISFTSSSTVRNFVRLFGNRRLDEIVRGSTIACIGPITAITIEELGGHADLVANRFTVTDMLHAIVQHCEADSRAVQ